MDKPKAIFCWSGGKDSAYCLHKILADKSFDVKYLLTTLNDNFKRVSMHGVREELLDKQVESIGIPLLKVKVQEGSNDEYERKMKAVLLKVKSEGICHVIFGDIFLEDLKKYREDNLAKVGMKAVFPLWKISTKILIKDLLRQKFRTVVCCTNDGYLGEEWVGKEIDRMFTKQLPTNVDLCGENGEFHTFCYSGPIFKKRINFIVGKKVYKPLNKYPKTSLNINDNTQGFWFCDLLPEVSIV